ncbi:hypothetical protein [Deinococcus multiflagellatus]|uniref:Uncharacterized protein n=1 Tax=Deinococcus multiflagellatus TaxID=1656887 RepID=A0ABW1ZLK1_9DEIO|nr:hypothetical protein [Deinococcus multiflagellatus]
MKRPSFDDLGLATARLWSGRSADTKVQVDSGLIHLACSGQ